MVTLLTDREAAATPGVRFMEMYMDTDVFYKLFYLVHQMGLAPYFTFDVEQNGRGVYVRINKKEDIEYVD